MYGLYGPINITDTDIWHQYIKAKVKGNVFPALNQVPRHEDIHFLIKHHRCVKVQNVERASNVMIQKGVQFEFPGRNILGISILSAEEVLEIL
jgi:hypothetical protein